MAKLITQWIEAGWKREAIKEENATIVQSVKTMEEVGVRLHFEGKSIRLDNEVINEERKWKPTWQKKKTCLQKAIESRRIEHFKTKEQQSQFFQELADECHLWLSLSLHGRNTSSIMMMLKQMVETRSWKAARGLVQDVYCRVCHKRDETIEHLAARCKVLANSKYLSRHDRALIIMSANNHGSRLGKGIQTGWWRYGLVQRTVGTRNGVGKQRKTRVGFRIPSM